MRTDVTHFQVVGVEVSFRRRLVVLVVTDAGVADDKRVDAQVEGSLRGVVGGQRVDDELEVGLSRRRLPVQVGVSTEELGRGDGYSAFCQWYEVDFGRQTGGTEHLLLLLVEDNDIVDDDTVQQSHVDAPHTDLSSQCLSDGMGHLLAEIALCSR